MDIYYEEPNYYEVCPESIQPFSVSRDPVAWPWSNLVASQRRPYCACVNSHSPVGLVSRQWDTAEWAYVLCDNLTHKSPHFQWRLYLWEKPKVAGSQICAVGGLTELGDMSFAQKTCRRAENWAGALSWCSCHHHLPTVASVYFLLHPSAGKGLWCSTP
jgi:hypothetical protein